MGLLQAIALEALSEYCPGLDLDSLRVNVLKGRLELSDVALGPGHVIAAAGLPFRLTHGAIGQLGLHIPWASIYSAPVKVSAHGVEVHFSEVRFAETQKEVFDAFRNESRRAKNRMLAEGEHAESAVTRALQKLLPTFVHRVEADITDVKLVLHFASGEEACVTLQAFTVSPVDVAGPQALAKDHGALAKQIVFKGLSASLLGDSRTVLAISTDLVILQLMLSESIYEVNVLLSDELSLALDLSLDLFLSCLRARICRWKRAALYGRPHETVSANSRSWLQYAVRAMCGRQDIARSELSVDICRRATASFRDYKRLHLLRLRNADALSEDDEKQIRNLEDVLDADMILLLRKNARADVMAEEVSAFATKEWLSWVFFDRRMSEEREHLSGEIRKSLYVVGRRERGEHDVGKTPAARSESLQALTRPWSHLKLSFDVKGFSTSLTNSKSRVGSLTLSGFQCQAMLDSGLRSYETTLIVSDFVLRDKDSIIACRGKISGEVQDNLDTQEGCAFFQAGFRRAASGNDISAELKIAPFVCLLAVNRFFFYSELVGAMSSLISSPPPNSLANVAEARYGKASKAGTPPRLAFQIAIPSAEVLVGYRQTIATTVEAQKWFLIHTHTITLCVTDMLNGFHMTGRVCGSIQDVPPSEFKPDVRRMLQVPGNDSVQSGKCLGVSTSAVIKLSSSSFSLQSELLQANLTSAGVHDLVCISRKALEQLVDIHVDSGRHTLVNVPLKKSSDLEAGRSYRFAVSSLTCSFHEFSNASSSLLSARLDVSELSITLSRESVVDATVKQARFSDNLHGGHAFVSGSPRHAFGIHLESCERLQGKRIDFDIKVASAFILLKPESLNVVVFILHRMTKALATESSRTGAMKPAGMQNDFSTPSLSPRVPSRTSAFFRDLQLRCLCEGSDIVLCTQNVFLVEHAGTWSGSVHSLEGRDHTELSAVHNVFLQKVPTSLPWPSDRRALSFNITPTSTNINIHSLQATVVRSSIERLVGMCQLLTDSVERAANTCKIAPDVDAAHDETPVDQPRRHSVSIQGAEVTVRLPVSLHGNGCICIETSLLTTTFGSDAFVLSLRKASVLTRGSVLEQTILSPEIQQETASTSKCAVVVRGLDLDVSHAGKADFGTSELIHQQRNDWNIQVLSKAAFFITASQMRLVQLLPRALKSTVHSATEPGTNHATKSADTKDRSDHKPHPVLISSFEHSTLKLQTQAISVEILNDDDRGSVVSTIAFLEMDPIRMSKRSACEVRSENTEMTVTRCTILCRALRLEDRDFEVPIRLREVISTRRNNGNLDNEYEATFVSKTDHALAIESVSRTDRYGVEKSSLSIEVKGLRVVPSPSLYERLNQFLVRSSVPVRKTTPGRSSRSSLSSKDRDEVCEDSQIDTVTSAFECSLENLTDPLMKEEKAVQKVSVKFSDTAIQVYGKGRSVSESSTIVAIGTLKTNLLFAADGHLLSGSEIRCKETLVSMIKIPEEVVPTEKHAVNLTDIEVSQTVQKHIEKSTKFLDGLNQTGPSFLSHHLTVPSKRLRWNFFRQDSDVHRAEELVKIPSAALRLPGRNLDRLTLLIPTVTVETHIQSLLHFAHLMSRLECLPKLDSNSEIILSPLQLSVSNISFRIRLPTSAGDDPENMGHLKHVSLRSRSSIEGVLGRNLSGLTASVQLTIDVFDEERGLRDRICSLIGVRIEGHFSDDISISLHCDRLSRIVVSPLTIRAVACLAFVASGKASRPKTVKNKPAFASGVGKMNECKSHETKVMNWTIALRGVAFCCIAENPRIQLLRLNLRQVSSSGHFSLPYCEKGKLELKVLDLVLEDTFSWRLYGAQDPTESSVHWTNIACGIRNRPRHKYSRYASLDDDCSVTDVPVLLSQFSWHHSFKHVYAHVQSRGFEINLDMAIVPLLSSWAASLSESMNRFRPQYTEDLNINEIHKQERHEFLIAVDQLAIGPIELVISTKAPPPRIRDSLLHRAFIWLVGSESISGITLTIPRIVLNGEFYDFDLFVQHLQRVYIEAFTSRQVGMQLLLQTASFSRLARTIYTSFVRRRATNLLQTVDLGSKQVAALPWKKSRGLLEATSEALSMLSTHDRVNPSHEATSVARKADSPNSETPYGMVWKR